MNDLVHIQNTDISVKEYRGQRVVTLKDVDMVHERPEGTARRNFNSNRNRFIDGEDYFVVSADEIRTSRMFPISDNDFTNKILLTEQGYLMLVKSFTDDLAWTVQRQLVNGYFKTRRLVNEELSPETQLILKLAQSIANKELEDKERDRQIALANETAKKAVETTETIKEAVKPVLDNWRIEINRKIKRVQFSSKIDFQTLNNQLYSKLEQRAGCDLGTRLRNMKQRMGNYGATKTAINSIRKIDVIEGDKKLREIFSKIVSEYEIKYCA